MPAEGKLSYLVSQKKLSRPAWWKNTYFWIAAILLIIGLYGMLPGKAESIRDPGQKREGGLVVFYIGAAALMLINGLLSHAQTVRQYEESTENEKTEEKSDGSLHQLRESDREDSGLDELGSG